MAVYLYRKTPMWCLYAKKKREWFLNDGKD